MQQRTQQSSTQSQHKTENVVPGGAPKVEFDRGPHDEPGADHANPRSALGTGGSVNSNTGKEAPAGGAAPKSVKVLGVGQKKSAISVHSGMTVGELIDTVCRELEMPGAEVWVAGKVLSLPRDTLLPANILSASQIIAKPLTAASTATVPSPVPATVSQPPAATATQSVSAPAPQLPPKVVETAAPPVTANVPRASEAKAAASDLADDDFKPSRHPPAFRPIDFEAVKNIGVEKKDKPAETAPPPSQPPSAPSDLLKKANDDANADAKQREDTKKNAEAAIQSTINSAPITQVNTVAPHYYLQIGSSTVRIDEDPRTTRMERVHENIRAIDGRFANVANIQLTFNQVLLPTSGVIPAERRVGSGAVFVAPTTPDGGNM